jgi:sec-independent protein translocase protein TatB
MLNVGAQEFLLIIIVAIIVIGPKDLPLALRTAGRWIGKVRRISRHFQQGVETMIREAELEEMEKKWREQNAAILAAHPPTPEETAADPTLAGAVPPPTADREQPPMQGDWPEYGVSTDPIGAPQPAVPDESSPELPLGSR